MFVKWRMTFVKSFCHLTNGLHLILTEPCQVHFFNFPDKEPNVQRSQCLVHCHLGRSKGAVLVQNRSRGWSPDSVCQGPGCPAATRPSLAWPPSHFPLWLWPCLLIHRHAPSCQSTFAFAISSAFCFTPRHPLSWLPHLLKVLAQMLSSRWIFYLKLFPPTLACLVSLALHTVSPHRICHIMYLFII